MAKNDLEARIKHPEDGAWRMGYTNATMASIVVGSSFYSAMLRLYEFMQPDADNVKKGMENCAKDELLP